jgi:hypothetical protein
MIFHSTLNGILLFVLGVISIDLLTKNFWIIALYASIWIAILLRKPSRKLIRDKFVSPVNGRVIRVLNSEVDGKKFQTMKILTNPILDAQTFRTIPSEELESFSTHPGSVLVQYKSGIKVKHKANKRLVNTIDIYRDQIVDGIYGHSFLGCVTTLFIPDIFKSELAEGQKVIDGETVIAYKQDEITLANEKGK